MVFYKWGNVKTGNSKGSGKFRAEAGVYIVPSKLLKEWAMENNTL